VGEAIAEECLHYGVGVVLGPGVNIKRSPLGGRGFEYYSEDPLLAGELAAGFITGAQGRGVGTSLKHYAVNSQETCRMSVNAAVDERALFEIYLKPFEIAIKKSGPDTVMASYNRVRGKYASEHRRLLCDILRLRFGFGGVVMTDWGAVNDRIAGLTAGCDLEMPYSGPAHSEAIARAVESGFVGADVLDTACFNLLRLVFRRARAGRPVPAADWQAHHALAAEALAQSAVLLKNEKGFLPLSTAGGRVAVIGELAEKPRYQGAGSSVINPRRLVSFLSAMKAAGRPFVYAAGYSGAGPNTRQMLQAAVAAAKAAEKVLLFLGLPEACECEGYDRTHLDLPAHQLKLLDAVSAANPDVAVVLCCGSPVAVPWLEQVRALLCPHLGGQAVGEGLVRLLYGEANPAGKLAETWPLAVEDTPCYRWFPMGPAEVSYNESIYVGYRYYDTAGKRVRFPFGYGLSYTAFAYSGLSLDTGTLKEGGTLTATLSVKNTGAVAGDEIVQCYLRFKPSAVFRPAQQLAGFARVSLAPGERKTVRVDVPYGALAWHDAASGADVVESGEYELCVGASSRDIRLRAGFAAEGAALPPAAGAADGSYGAPKDNTFPARDFAVLYGKPLADNARPRRGAYTATTPLGLMDESPAARRLLRLARFVGRRTLHFSADPAARERAVLASTHDLPFKNFVFNTAGVVGPAAGDALLRLCNGTGSLARFLNLLLRRR
jgi:beta-glucosidase